MYCIKCLKYYAKHKLQNINRCCRGQICKICMIYGNYMCFYCKAHSSRYMQNGELQFDKAYKYIIRKYKYKDIVYGSLWYINFNSNREGDKFTYFYLYMNGIVYKLEWQSNGELHRNYDKPAYIDLNSIFKVKDVYMDQINSLAWQKNGRRHREENKPAYIKLHFNGNIWNLEWYYNDVPLHINKLQKLYLNEDGGFYFALKY